MKKIFTFISLVALALNVQAQELDKIEVNGLWYQLDSNQTATLIPAQNEAAKYEQETIVIPATISHNEVEYPVVALAKAAFRNSTASSITFAQGSHVTELGMQVFQAAVNLQELELPEGVRLIPMTGIHNATATNPMTMKRLILPATVDSLALFSICLPQLEMLEFKGAVPPSIASKVTATWTQNPWQINLNNACNTNPEAIVIVPAGAVETYRNTAWIGDYFTTILPAKDTIQVDGLYYQLDNKLQTATLIRLTSSSVYDIENIVIPVSVSKDGRDYPVVALGQGAFRNSTASSITFAEGSEVTELGTQVFQAAVNLQELELPEGVRLIPMTAIHNATATNPMTMKKLVLPASVDSLALFSICLPQLDTLEFKGVVPPSIATKLTATWTQNPWQISLTNVCNTNPEAVVIVPVGALQAYRQTEWIGDYFTTIQEKSDVPSDVEDVQNTHFKSGIYSITGTYLGEELSNLPKGIYIVNGKKIVR